MKNFTVQEINQLQNCLQLIRQAGGWSAEEFGDMIGVTKQTISNLENNKTPMSKTQYIAIRAVLDGEIEERGENDQFLSSFVDFCLNKNGLSDEGKRKAAGAFLSGAKKTGMDDDSVRAGVSTLIGTALELLNPLKPLEWLFELSFKD